MKCRSGYTGNAGLLAKVMKFIKNVHKGETIRALLLLIADIHCLHAFDYFPLGDKE